MGLNKNMRPLILKELFIILVKGGVFPGFNLHIVNIVR